MGLNLLARILPCRINFAPEDVLVAVHADLLKYLCGAEAVKIRADKTMRHFGVERTYHSQLFAYNMPLGKSSRHFPSPEKVGAIYVVGCSLEACIDAQVEWLEDNGYNSINLVKDSVV